MILNYIPNKPKFEDTDLSKSYQITNDQNEDIGTIEGYGNIDGSLFSSVKIYNLKYQRKGIGFEAFKKVFDEINAKVPIKVIIGSWNKGQEFQYCEDGMSTNLKVFLESIKTETDEKSAFLTPTGKWARKLGFNKCVILSKSIDDVIIAFTVS